MVALATDERVIELFAGPGGMSEGFKLAGLNPSSTLGIEWDIDACGTAMAAGHPRMKADVSIIDPKHTAWTYFDGPITGFHASPPCQGFSMAGKGKGRQDAEYLLTAIAMIETGTDPADAIEWLKGVASDDKSALTLEPLRWVKELMPEWITQEQVPSVLPVWERMARVYQKWGYNVVTGKVYSEQYGVPQTRTRAILLGSRVREVALPTPTHSRYYNRSPEKLDAVVSKWVTMAEALEWGMTHRPYPTVAAGTTKGGTDPQAVGGSGARKIIATERAEGRWTEQPADHRLRDDLMLCPTNLRPNAALRRLDQPAPTMAFGHETPRWVTPEEVAEYRARVAAKAAERENNQSGTEFDLAWPCDRPAPTVAGRDIVTMPGANANRFNGSTKSRNDGLRVTIEEAGVLQSFPADYPWIGGKGSVFQQCGNAVPPLMAMHMAKCVLEWAQHTETLNTANAA